MRLVAIGFLSHYQVYVNLTKAEAIARYNGENPDSTVEADALEVKEIEVADGKFLAYDLSAA